MAEDDDDSQKTEEPSERRLNEAKEKGQSFNSKEINHFFILLAFTFSIGSLSPKIFKDLTYFMSLFIENSYQIRLDQGNIFRIIIGGFSESFFIIIIPLLASFIAIIIANYIQHGEFRISSEALIPKLEKISPIKGFAKIFSVNSFIEFIKNIAKFILIGVICYLSIIPKTKYLKILHEYSTIFYIKLLLSSIDEMLVRVCIAIAFLAGLDYFYQRFSFYKSMRMSKQDIKDEYKQTEGSPEIKSRLRSLRLEKAKKRMMSQVPKASVVITNPTHYAIALKYNLGDFGAPIVIAMGKDLMALKIKEIAKENNVPVVQNASLARALYSSAKLDYEIPFEHYKAVAEIINYINKLSDKTK